MGKMKNPKKFGHKISAPGPLEMQINNDKIAKATKRVKGRQIKRDAKAMDKKKAENISSILQQARMDLDEEEDYTMMDLDDDTDKSPVITTKLCKDFEKEMKITMSEEERMFESLMPSGGVVGKSHMALLREGLMQARVDVQADLESNIGTVANKQLVSTLAAAGVVLANHTSRTEKIPRIVADLPRSKGWLKKLYHTNPEKWSAAAMFTVTKRFCATTADVTEQFVAKVLLPRCRDDIAYYKRLNQHLYRALRLVMKRPVAFFGGIVMPLCQSGDCSLREAIVFSSVLAKHHYPTIAASAGLLHLTQLPYSGACSIFIRVLLNKKYMLQYSVVDACAAHFVSFKADERELPTLWHQSLLTFAQRYRSCLTQQQKTDLQSLTAYHCHRAITKEVHVQLVNSACRPPPKAPSTASKGGLVL